MKRDKMTRHEMYADLVEDGVVKEWREWRHHGIYSDLEDGVRKYSEYVDDIIDNMSEYEVFNMISNHYYNGIEEFVADNPFIIEYILTGKSPEIDNSMYIMRKDENDTYIQVSDLCMDCEEPEEWCICDDEDEEEEED